MLAFINLFIYFIDSIEFWDDLVSSRDAKELEELIPLFINNRRFAFDENEESELIQEIVIDNSVNSLLIPGSRERECKKI